MYDLPKKEDALLYQSKGKAGMGRALMSLSHTLQGFGHRETPDLTPSE